MVLATVHPINGGLGNQIFRIAMLFSYSKKHKCKPVLRKRIHATAHVKHSQKSYWDTVFKNVKWPCPGGNVKWVNVKEKGFGWNKFGKPSRDVRLVGYFQSPFYFEYKKELVKFLKPKDLVEKARKKLSQLVQLTKQDREVVGVHVRRGDYIHLKDFHPPQSLGYYRKAMSKFPNALFVIFTNDYEWCEENLKGNNSGVVISKTDEVMELYMMSLCDHNIIANSSFSWWGAYLNENPSRKVIAPRVWFGPRGPKDWSTIYEKDWIRM